MAPKLKKQEIDPRYDKIISTDSIPGASSMTPQQLLSEKKKRADVMYLLTAHFEKIKAEEEQKRFEKFNDELDKTLDDMLDKKKAPPYMTDAAKSLVRMEESKKAVTDFFSYKDRPDAKEIKDTLKELDMTDEEFSLVALAASGEKAEDIINAVNEDITEKQEAEKKASQLKSPQGQDLKTPAPQNIEIKAEKPEKAAENNIAAKPKESARLEKFKDIKEKSINDAKEAIMSLKKGNPEMMGKMMGNFMANACDKFAREKNNDTAMQWAMYTGEMMKMMEKKPELAKHCGLNEQQMLMASNVVKMGNSIKEGLKAAETLANAKLNNKIKISPEQQKTLSQKVMDMQVYGEARKNIFKELEGLQSSMQKTSKPDQPVLNNKTVKLQGIDIAIC